MTTKRLTLCAVLAALALALSYAERMFLLPLPLPGLRLGLANVVTLFALYALGVGETACILTVRVLLGAIFAGNASALLYSLLGGAAAFAVMALLVRSRLSVYGVSVVGAAAHNCGQIAAAMLVLGSGAPLLYLPPLLLLSLLTGACTGFLAALLFRALRDAGPDRLLF